VKNSLNKDVQTTEQYYKAQLDIQLSKKMHINRYIKVYIIINIYKYIIIVII